MSICMLPALLPSLLTGMLVLLFLWSSFKRQKQPFSLPFWLALSDVDNGSIEAFTVGVSLVGQCSAVFSLQYPYF